jgi:putative endonuclease
LWAEALCRFVLRVKGYRIVARRYRSKLGEIDIVAARGRSLAFVEVKARGSYDVAAEAITLHQRQRLQRAAEDFLARHPHYGAYGVRFDAMMVTPWRWPKHIVNAWDET